ncbi:BTB/POZ and MATH domain-containing protein 1-like [Triticum dicoccoides]|uniref:BTB/POZ and MATH domain-containing protein 1-like n=1 Tax=Triticum dicoccoides TaxID=85692 RepID=UPI001890CF4F|nr:BTB/POZ and MATH domain-containing protein 1-like [Triticum dicoccoides]
MASSGAGRGPSRSVVVANTTSGHHLLTIHGYSRTKAIPTGKRVKSRSFFIGGHRWRMEYYPNGSRPAVADFVSLSLLLHEDVTPGVKAQFDICLAGGEEEALQAASMASRPVDHFPSQRGWAYSTFIKRDELESSKHLRNDSFTVRCDIVVFHGYRAADAAAFVSVPPCDLRQNLSRLLETKMGADVVFDVGSETIAAHRCVLAACSPVFAAELFGPMKEGNAAGSSVRVEDMDAEVFKALLRYAYTGSLPDMRKEEEDVTCQHLLAADRYGMERLKLMCEEKLCKYIDVGRAATILMLAERHHCEGLKKACFNFLALPANLRATVATDGLQHLSESCPSLMVKLMAMSFDNASECSSNVKTCF